MKRFFAISLVCLLGAASGLRAQDTATAAATAARAEAEERYNSLKGQVDDLLAAQADQAKRMQALAKEIEELRALATKPAGNFASPDDLKHLADAVQEIDKKRLADNELILKQIEKIEKALSVPPPAHGPGRTTAVDAPPRGNSGGTSKPTGGKPVEPVEQNGYYYVIKKNDTVSDIAKACREQGIPVTTEQIEAANPKLNPDRMIVGHKIFIPAPKGAPPAK